MNRTAIISKNPTWYAVMRFAIDTLEAIDNLHNEIPAKHLVAIGQIQKDVRGLFLKEINSAIPACQVDGPESKRMST